MPMVSIYKDPSWNQCWGCWVDGFIHLPSLSTNYGVISVGRPGMVAVWRVLMGVLLMLVSHSVSLVGDGKAEKLKLIIVYKYWA
jgi:hypothetical protein